MSLHVLAHHMASKGRGGDSMLVHMTPGEVQGLQALAFKMGGTLTINPETGLPEANFLKKMLPILAGAALNFFAPGIGTAIGAAFGASGAVGTGLLVGGVTGLATGSLSKGLMAGLGAYGGAGIGEAFAGAGTSALGTEAYSNALKQGALEGITPPPEALQSIVQDKITSATPWEKMGAGWDAATKSPTSMWDFAKSAKGPLSAAGMSYMAGQEPAKLDIPTTTQTPAMMRPMHMTRERIMPGDPDYQVNEQGSQIGYFRTNYTTPEPYPAAANGGIVALADGGNLVEQVSREQQYTRNPNQADQFANDAYLPAHGINLDTMQYYFPELNQGKNAQEEYNRAMAASNQPSASGAVFGGSPTADQGNAFTVGSGQQVNSQQSSGAVFGGSPTPTPAPSPFTVGGAQAAAPSGIETLSAQPAGQDLSGTVAGAFVGPRNTVITYDSTGKQTDTGRPASALNDYLTGAQESGPGSFVRSLSWGVSPEEDAKSVLKLKDYARSKGLSESELLSQSGL